MYKGRKIIGIIPARGGSKGLPAKNIKLLSGRPLLAWTIEQAQGSKYLDTIFVSTDDDKIADVARGCGIEVPFLRPAMLAMDNSPTIDTIAHTISYFEKNNHTFDFIALLEPTSPLRKKHDIDAAISLLIDNEEVTNSLVSVGEVHIENPYITKIITDNYVRPLIQDKADNIFQRQQLPKIFFPYGVIYISKASSLLREKTFYQDMTIPYLIERWQNYEVDDIFDFICIEAVLKHMNREVVAQ